MNDVLCIYYVSLRFVKLMNYTGKGEGIRGQFEIKISSMILILIYVANVCSLGIQISIQWILLL